MQYFVGLNEFTRERPFAPLSLSLFRKKITPSVDREIRRIIKAADIREIGDDA